jgi:hypothetical protein
MKLTWRDGATTILAGLTVAAVVAVMQGWGWPLLGSVAAGVGVVGALGWAMCLLGGVTGSVPSMKDPFTVGMSVLGSVALVLIVVGVIAKSEGVLVALAVVTVLMWVVSTTAHAVRRQPTAPVRRPLQAADPMTCHEEPTMLHHIVYWTMAKREVDVDDAQLSELRRQERLGELYIEFLDGQRLPRIWDHGLSDWVAAKGRSAAAA